MPGSDRPAREGYRGRPERAGDDRGRSARPSGDDRGPSVGRHVDEPEVPESVKPNDLDKGARGELRTLSKENADAVARHLVMAGRLVEEDPAEAHRHALAASRRAGRVAVVRESLAITAYATGDFALALRELRTFRRISGSDDQIGLMVDSERGVGRPDRALELGRSVDRASLPAEAQVALAIAMSGARLDLEDPRGALDELERAPLDLQHVHPWSSALYESLAAVHEDLGDTDEAARWQRRADRAEELLDQVGEEESTVAVSTEDDPAFVPDPADAERTGSDEQEVLDDPGTDPDEGGVEDQDGASGPEDEVLEVSDQDVPPVPDDDALVDDDVDGSGPHAEGDVAAAVQTADALGDDAEPAPETAAESDVAPGTDAVEASTAVQDDAEADGSDGGASDADDEHLTVGADEAPDDDGAAADRRQRPSEGGDGPVAAGGD